LGNPPLFAKGISIKGRALIGLSRRKYLKLTAYLILRRGEPAGVERRAAQVGKRRAPHNCEDEATPAWFYLLHPPTTPYHPSDQPNQLYVSHFNRWVFNRQNHEQKL
jgi:hypothetical protein